MSEFVAQPKNAVFTVFEQGKYVFWGFQVSYHMRSSFGRCLVFYNGLFVGV